MSIAYSNWGNSLSDLSELESDHAERKRLLEESCRKYEKAVTIDSNLAQVYYNWGNSLFHLSKLESDHAERKKLLKESCRKYEKAVTIDSNLAQVYSNWGNSLSDLSELESDHAERKRLLEESCRKYEKAVTIDSNLAKAYYNWGNSLSDLSELESDHAIRKRLLEESCRKYEKAVTIDSNYAKAYSNWGIVLLISNTDLDSAKKLFVKASQIFKGIDSDKMKAFQEWAQARKYMNRRNWELYRERIQEAKRIFEEIDDPFSKSATLSIEFSYIDDQLEKILNESDAKKALKKLINIFQDLPDLSILPDPERTMYLSRIATFEIIKNFLTMLFTIDDSTDFSSLKKNFNEFLNVLQEIEAKCELINFLVGKRAVVDIADIIENSLQEIEDIQKAPASCRDEIINEKLNNVWKKISVAIPLLNGEFSTNIENINLSKQLYTVDRKLGTLETDLKEVKGISEKTLETIEKTKTLIIKKDVVRSEYIFEIREPLILGSFLPFSNRLRIIVKLGSLTDTDIEDIIDSINKLNAKGKKKIISKLKSLKVDKKLLKMLGKVCL
jgi:tetratricopeptide (TPR) repeat protein